VLWWLAAAAAELWTGPPGCKLLAATLAWPGIAALPWAWLFFLHRHGTGRTGRPPRWQVAVIAGSAALATVAAATNPRHGLFYGPGTIPAGGLAGAPILFDHGPLFWVVAAALYLALAATLAMLVLAVRRADPAHRPSFALLLALTAVPVAGNLGYVFGGVTLGGSDPTPLLFGVMLIVYLQFLTAGRVFDLAETARRVIFDTLSNPVIVADASGRLMAANPRAAELFGLRPDGRADLRALPGIGPVVDRLAIAADAPLRREIAVAERHFDLHLTPVAAPLALGSPVMGWVLFLHDITAQVTRQRELQQALEVSARQLTEITRLNREFEAQARLDPLTGLMNRRGLRREFDALAREVAARLQDAGADAPGDAALRVAMIDLDRFKTINDSFGHDAGDLVLRAFARRLRRAFRRDDRLFRLGGEEFLVLCPGSAAAGLDDRLSALRAALAGMDELANLPGVVVDFSAGIAVWPQDGTGIERVMQAADRRLYRAKASGRGRSIGPQDPAATGEAGDSAA
jgi:diguanylate cyclase (GGDEF)-like protein